MDGTSVSMLRLVRKEAFFTSKRFTQRCSNTDGCQCHFVCDPARPQFFLLQQRVNISSRSFYDHTRKSYMPLLVTNAVSHSRPIPGQL